MAPGAPAAAKRRFPHHPQRHAYGCAAAALRMAWQWASGRDLGEAHFRRALAAGPRGATVGAVEQVLLTMEAAATGRLRVSWVDVDHFATRARRVPDGTVFLVLCDAFEPDGANVGHWLVVLDVFTAAALPGAPPPRRLPVALLADPLAAGLRAEAFAALVAQRVRRVYELRLAPLTGTRPRRSTRRRPR